MCIRDSKQEAARKETEERVRREAQEAARKETEERVRRETEEAARKETEERVRRETEEAARARVDATGSSINSTLSPSLSRASSNSTAPPSLGYGAEQGMSVDGTPPREEFGERLGYKWKLIHNRY